MARSIEYLVYRVGSNSSNQPCTFEPVPIAIVRASSREAAAATSWHGEEPSVHGCPSLASEVLAHCGNIDVWSNQHVYAVPRSKVRGSDWNAVLEAEAFSPSDAELEAEAAATEAYYAKLQAEEEAHWRELEADFC